LCFVEVATREICFKFWFSTNFVKYTRESDYFSRLIILGSREVATYKQINNKSGFRSLSRRDQQEIVRTSSTKGLCFYLAKLVTHTGGFLKL
jgi:hypothetical protein